MGNPVHRGIFRGVPAPEDRRRDHHAPARSRVPDPDGGSAAAGRSERRARAGVLQDRPRDPRRRIGPEAARPGHAPRRLRELRRPSHSLSVDRRHAPRLARPGPLPRAHRRIGSVGDGGRLRGSRRQDEEPLLRHARRARRSCSSMSSSTSSTRPTSASRRSTSASCCRPKSRAHTAASAPSSTPNNQAPQDAGLKPITTPPSTSRPDRPACLDAREDTTRRRRRPRGSLPIATNVIGSFGPT